MFGFTYGFGFGGSGGGSVSAWLSLNGDLTTVDGIRYLVNSKGDDIESTTGEELTAGTFDVEFNNASHIITLCDGIIKQELITDNADYIQDAEIDSNSYYCITEITNDGYTMATQRVGVSTLIPRLKLPNTKLGSAYRLIINETVNSGSCDDFKIHDGANYVIQNRTIGGAYTVDFTRSGTGIPFIGYNGKDYQFDISVTATLKRIS